MAKYIEQNHKEMDFEVGDGAFILMIDRSKEGKWGGTISSSLKHCCSFCKDGRCDMFCEDAQEWIYDRDFEEQQNKTEQLREKQQHNECMDVVESFVLSMACEGYDVTTDKFKTVIQTVLDGYTNKNR
jgi:hypothetical protein